jgi:5-methyltetrahydropteroyltriglutamate--homocysteine methyltransferase
MALRRRGVAPGRRRTWPHQVHGQALIQRDIANFKVALAEQDVADAFMTAAFTGVQIGPNDYYKTRDEQAVALAEAMREEYRAIVAAGLNVQIDDPLLVNVYEMQYSLSGDLGLPALGRGARRALESRARRHSRGQDPLSPLLGQLVGPHSTDLPLREVIDLLVKIKGLPFEAANPQHEHEWKVWEGRVLPEGRAVIPGVVTHKTNIRASWRQYAPPPIPVSIVCAAGKRSPAKVRAFVELAAERLKGAHWLA